jgi:hypothetical protein
MVHYIPWEYTEKKTHKEWTVNKKFNLPSVLQQKVDVKQRVKSSIWSIVQSLIFPYAQATDNARGK